MKHATVNATHFSPEMKLLLSCCIMDNGEQQPTNTRLNINRDIDWNSFLKLVHYHQVTPLVYYNLQKYCPIETDGKTDSTAIPPRIRNHLKSRFNKHRQYAMALTSQLLQINTACRNQNIGIICLKGPILAYRLYGDIALRQIMDIDLLIDETDLEKIHTIITSLGYQNQYPELFSSKLHWKVFKKSKHHIPYTNKDKHYHLELHFRLFKNIYVWPCQNSKSKTNQETVEYAGVKLTTLSATENILFLFIHGSIHKWFMLKWLADVARLCITEKVDWKKLRDYSLELGLERPVLQGLLLVNQLFDIPIPDEFVNVPISKTVRKMTELAITTIHDSNETTRYGFVYAFQKRFYLLKLKKNRLYKFRYLRDLIYLDSHRDILRLPGFLYPLYLILNPFLWFYKNYINNTGLPPKFHKSSEKLKDNSNWENRK